MCNSFAQKTDSLYIKNYPQKIKLMGYVATNSIEIDEENNNYSPNYPLTTGIGFSIKNTIFAMQLGYSFIPLKNNDKYGKTKVVDFQVHNYGKRFLVDLFYQDYKGFYSQKENNDIIGIYPDMSVQQIGAEGTYIFNGSKFSAKAAFEQSEIQLQSAGSFLLGGGTYYYQLKGFDNNNQIENFQLGINAGYAYSWVINKYWLLSGMAKVGANFGNEPELFFKKGKTEVYPTAFVRFSGSYHESDWALSMSVLLNTKSVYPLNRNEELNLTTLGMQLSYVKHLDNILKKKN